MTIKQKREENIKLLLTPPHPSARARSFPVPSGRTPTAGGGTKLIWSSIERTHPTVPSPPHASTLKLGTFRNNSRPSLGPPCVRSKTWRGFRSHWNFCSNFAPFWKRKQRKMLASLYERARLKHLLDYHHFWD